ncbi:GroES-like protein [Amniculicola lignicola CBS 123094]|uniref:GroES-like protein n=1 Tax=Amniculicola lignicola CBS 123094 TaxID=1392246 RepID=A0A6A5WK52_9PLEO|nr:GroES-like protein [Amniculicola lignicola CBS 123094]
MGLVGFLKSCFATKSDIEEIQSSRQAPTTSTKTSYTPLTSSEKSVKLIAVPTTTEISTPPTQTALVVAAKHTYKIDDVFPTPDIQDPDEVLIRNHAVGLNPIDWKSVDWNFCLPTFPWVTGREMSGVVEQVGENVTEFKRGDRVWTSTYYRDIRSGCFQDYVISPRHTVKPIPNNLSFEDAACLGVCGLTAAMTLWKWLEVPIFNTAQPISKTDDNFLLVWGGSSITSQFIIQIATYSGLEVIAVASDKTRDLVRGLGARHVVTRDNKSNEEIVAEARAIGGDRIVKGVDVVGPETAVHCISALSSSLPVQFAPLSFLPEDFVAPSYITVQNVEMKWFILEKTSEIYAVALNKLLEEGVVKVPRLEVLNGGLRMIEEGLNMHKRGDRGGKKLIVSLRS